MTVMTYVMTLEDGQSSQGTFEPITLVINMYLCLCQDVSKFKILFFCVLLCLSVFLIYNYGNFLIDLHFLSNWDQCKWKQVVEI